MSGNSSIVENITAVTGQYNRLQAIEKIFHLCFHCENDFQLDFTSSFSNFSFATLLIKFNFIDFSYSSLKMDFE